MPFQFTVFFCLGLWLYKTDIRAFRTYKTTLWSVGIFSGPPAIFTATSEIPAGQVDRIFWGFWKIFHNFSGIRGRPFNRHFLETAFHQSHWFSWILEISLDDLMHMLRNWLVHLWLRFDLCLGHTLGPTRHSRIGFLGRTNQFFSSAVYNFCFFSPPLQLFKEYCYTAAVLRVFATFLGLILPLFCGKHYLWISKMEKSDISLVRFNGKNYPTWAFNFNYIWKEKNCGGIFLGLILNPPRMRKKYFRGLGRMRKPKLGFLVQFLNPILFWT